MNKTKEIIVNSLKYYDLNCEKYSKIYKRARYYSYKKGEHELDHDIISLYDKNKNKYFSSRYEILGIYTAKSHTWAWSWSIPTVKNNAIVLAKKILNYGLDIVEIESTFLKSELITSRFEITDYIQLEIHAAIASYISKNSMIFNIIYDTSKEIDDENIFEISKEITENCVVWYIYLLDKS